MHLLLISSLFSARESIGACDAVRALDAEVGEVVVESPVRELGVDLLVARGADRTGDSTTTNDTRGLATNTNLHREQQQTYWTTQTDSIQRVRAHSVNSRQSWSSAKGEHHTQALVRLRTTDHLGPFLRGYI